MFHDTPKIAILQKSAKRSLLPLKPYPFGTKFQNVMFFRVSFLDTLVIFILFYSKMVDLGTPCKIQCAPKWHPKSTNIRQKGEQSIAPSSLWGVLEPMFYWMDSDWFLIDFGCGFCLSIWGRLCSNISHRYGYTALQLHKINGKILRRRRMSCPYD